MGIRAAVMERRAKKPAWERAAAKRTARALAGMESIGDIASADPNREFLAEVEDLFAKCKEIRELCEAQSGRDPNLSS
jgi:hypothetical protein